MREIKFRAWEKDAKVMIVPGNKLGIAMSFDGDVFVAGARNSDFILMQYTGLKDKNGKEIYEGDIVKNDITNYFIGKVALYRQSFGLWVPTLDMPGNFAWWLLSDFEGYKFEVIGNIYENPDLLLEE